MPLNFEYQRINPLISEELRRKLLGDVPTLGDIPTIVSLPRSLNPFALPIVVEGKEKEEEG